MSEQAIAQTLRERAQQLNEQLKARIEQLNKEAREIYSKTEARVSELLEEYKTFESPLAALKEGSSKLQQSAREIQQQQAERLSNLGSQLLSSLGLPSRSDVEALEKKVSTLNTKVKKLEKAAKA